MILNGRAIDRGSLEVDGIDMRDYPDFCDAYFVGGNFADGELEDLTEKELDALRDLYPDELHCLVWNKIY